MESTEHRPFVAVVGMESVGKSSLLSALTNRFAESSPSTGTTIHCQRYSDTSWDYLDTPGIVTGSDAVSVADTIKALPSADSILIVLRSYRAQTELTSLLPILGHKKVAIALTFKDKLLTMTKKEEEQSLLSWREQLGVPVCLIDGRRPDAAQRQELRTAIQQAQYLKSATASDLATFKEDKKKLWLFTFERLMGFAPLSLFLLFAPAWIAVTEANALADRFYDAVGDVLTPLLKTINVLPGPVAACLGGDYGVVSMFPFMILYALPTILIFTLLIAIYKSTGLIDRLSYGLHPWLKPFGLGGRDLVRVVMGFGCNVPAVVASRSCSSCSRGACVSAISFGSACSYQLPATLAVFSSTGHLWLGPVYLAVLAVTTLTYLRLTTSKAYRQAQNAMLLPELGNLRLPHWGSIGRESLQTLRDFTLMALPIFTVICVVAGLLQWSGALDIMTRVLSPVMALFNLPPEATLSVVLGAVRKDGLAIGLLDGDWSSMKVPLETPVQVLTVVYLAGVMLPCLVTLWTIAKEMKYRFAIKMVAKQAGYAAAFSLCIAWIGCLFL